MDDVIGHLWVRISDFSKYSVYCKFTVQIGFKFDFIFICIFAIRYVGLCAIGVIGRSMDKV